MLEQIQLENKRYHFCQYLTLTHKKYNEEIPIEDVVLVAAEMVNDDGGVSREVGWLHIEYNVVPLPTAAAGAATD